MTAAALNRVNVSTQTAEMWTVTANNCDVSEVPVSVHGSV